MIRRLPQEIAEKIAAGEVIERPLSVIKELIENSIDAKSTQIDVEIEDGGKNKITITDNGTGIPSEELKISLERHATSKIQSLEDLWNLNTMGFRGEALPSIATISRFTLASKYQGEKGRTLYLEGGKIQTDVDAANPFEDLHLTGTQIIVEDLFYNVPARLKFQRSRTGESSAVRELIEHFALVHSHIGFKLISENRKSIDLPPQSEEARIASIFGSKTDDLEHFQSTFEGIHVEGYLDRNARVPNSKQIYLCANNRIVKDKLLQQAVMVALRPRMMEGEYPRLFVKVTVPASDIDVNVHPTKSEVRFRKSRDVFQVIHGALSKLAQLQTKAYYSVPTPTASSSTFKPLNVSSFYSSRPEQPDLILKSTQTISDSIYSKGDFETNQDKLNVIESISNENLASTNSIFGTLKYIGQLKNTYLLFQDKDGLIILDQHAAHERIQYEKIKSQFLKEHIKPKPLLVSITYKCNAEDINIALENHDVFEKMGFEVEAFGDQCLILRTIPQMLEPKHSIELFESLLNQFKDMDAAGTLDLDPTRLSPKVERLISTLACHSSIRAGQPMSEMEAIGLLDLMEKTNSSLNCPHGRPASIQLNFEQIENLFKR